MFVPFYPPHTGGVEYYAESLSEHLSTHDIEITILTPQLPKHATYPIAKNITIIPYPAFEIIHNYPIPKFWNAQCVHIFSTQACIPYQAIITHTRFFVSSFIGTLLSVSYKIPHIHIEHGSSFVQSNNPLIACLAWLFDHSFGKYVLTQSQHTIAVSESVERFVKKIAPRSDIRVIYRGFDSKKIVEIPPNESCWPSDSSLLKFIFIGRLVSSKGIYELIDALAALPIHNWTCTYIGDGEESAALKKRIQSLCLQDKVKLLGARNWNETIGILKGSDIFISPSYTEGLPTTVLEAALCGIPTIATDVGGTNEISPLTFLVPPKNSAVLTSAIIDISHNIQKNKVACKEKIPDIEKKFSWQTAIPKFVELLKPPGT